eukprot:scaffold7079_cov99-Amphora_coffeaeformis.AAC.1
MDAIARRATGLRGGVAGVNAEVIVEDGPVDAGGGEGVPVGLDDGGEAFLVAGFRVEGMEMTESNSVWWRAGSQRMRSSREMEKSKGVEVWRRRAPWP